MDKSRMKSILPKPSMSTPSPTIGAKRKSAPSDYYAKHQKTSPHSSPRPSHKEICEQPQSSKQSRPVTSCTFCRQHKIKCNASENYPSPCTRCSKMGLKCEIDPQFKPKKGSQIQMLIGDVEELKNKIEMLSKNEHLLTQALNQHNMNFNKQSGHAPFPQRPSLSHNRARSSHNTPTSAIEQIAGATMSSPGVAGPGSVPPSHSYPSYHGNSAINDATGPTLAITNLNSIIQADSSDNSPNTLVGEGSALDNFTQSPEEMKESHVYSEFILGEVRLTLDKANELHDRFLSKFLPFLPILTSRSATELYSRSQLLFWTVMSTASLSEPDPGLYMSLASLIKQLAIETCWIRTPRSTHVVQALIILSIWPLPNEKVLDDCSYRFVGLAKNLALQLGLHRGGEFIQEFSRNQASLGPNSDLWRTRSWLAVFFCDQFWSSTLGLPPSINTTDYLLENARVDDSLPANFRCLISLSIFQCKLVNVMGISVTRSDGLLEPSNRAASLNILDRELERLKFKLNIMEGSAIEIYYLYLRLMICCFAFLPGTPIEDQVKYVSTAYLSATRIITISSQLVSNHSISLIELPIYVRQAITYAAFLLFKLHLSRYLMDKYVDSARQSIVTVHRLYRNTLSSWKDLQNDLSRTAKVLENLNIVLYTYPEIFNVDEGFSSEGSIISKMRSHLTASLFYDLVWSIHEARRRTLVSKSKDGDAETDVVKVKSENDSSMPQGKRPQPLPFYNQITKDDFKAMTTTTPNGTTITTLVPTDEALNQAKLASGNGLSKPLEINGIPLAMLEATGSTKDADTVKYTNVDTEMNQIEQKDVVPGFPADFSQTSPMSAQSQLDRNGQGDSLTQYGAQPSRQGPELQSQQGSPVFDSQFGTTGDRNPVSGNYNYNGMGGAGIADQLDNFFQQQSHGWLNNNNHQDDDFLGWIDVNMLPDA